MRPRRLDDLTRRAFLRRSGSPWREPTQAGQEPQSTRIHEGADARDAGDSAAVPWAALAAAAALAGCGSDEDPGPSTLPAAFQSPGAARADTTLLRRPMRAVHAMSASAAAVAQAAATMPLPPPTATELMDWAQEAYPAFFPGSAADRQDGPYTYRHYPSSGNYVGVASGEVYVLGPVSDGSLLRVGSLADFAPQVFGTPRAVDAADASAVRALLQAQFSASATEIADVKRLGFTAWLDAQLAAPRSIEAVAWLDSKGYDKATRSNQFHLSSFPAQAVIWNQLWTAPDATRMRMALALSEYFVITTAGFDFMWLGYGAAGFWDVLVRHAFGNFRQLLEEVTLTASMGQFLSVIGSQKADGKGRMPDENYAREVMQLFTIGLHELSIDGTPKLDARGAPIETYDNDDVTQLAKVFTGYDFATPTSPSVQTDDPLHPVILHKSHVLLPMRLITDRHSFDEVRFLGHTIPANTEPRRQLQIALDVLFSHPNVGPFFGRQMIQRLVTSNPSPAYVARVAQVFNNNGNGVRGDLKAVFRAILLDAEARNVASTEAARIGRLSEPMLRIVQFGRQFAAPATRARWRGYHHDYGQQLPLHGPSVFNFFRPGHVPPGTALAAHAWVAPEFQIVGESSVALYVNQMQYLARWGFRTLDTDNHFSKETGEWIGSTYTPVQAEYADELQLASHAPLLIRHLNLRLAAGRLPGALQQTMIDALNATPLAADSPLEHKLDRVAAAVLMVMSSPEYLVQK